MSSFNRKHISPFRLTSLSHHSFMAFHNSISFLILLSLFTCICSSHAHTFQVGGKDGWTLHPSENYNGWSSRLRFLINDTLHFKYNDGSDSVLVVNKSDYDGCNVNNPINKMDGGDSTFKFDRSGPFYFITGNKSNCDQGQKLIVVVLALRKRSTPPSVATPPYSSTMPPSPILPPSISPISPPSTAVSPVSPPSMSPTLPPSTAVSPVLPPSMSPVSPPSFGGSPTGSPFGTPISSPSGTPIFSPPAPPSMSPVSPPSFGGSPAGSPFGTPVSSPSGTPIFSPPAPSPPGGAGGLSPEGSGSGANSTTPSSSAMPPLSGTIIRSVVTIMFGLWGLS